MDFYSMKKDELISSLRTTPEGLTTTQAGEHLIKYGANQLTEKPRPSLLSRIIAQISDPMILVLIFAALVSGFVSEITDMLIIFTVVAINAIMGLVQESKAEKSIEALKKMSSPHAKVKRDGQIQMLDSSQIVPGDFILVEAGDTVPCDLRLLDSSNLKIEEASLTGESVPSEKDAAVEIDGDRALGDRTNMAYMGTNVIYGRGSGIAVTTGMSTEMGAIATMLDDAKDQQTPLQRKLAEISKVLTWLVLVICVAIFFTNIYKHGGFSFETVVSSFMLAISLAVAAIPEGLPAVVTIVMSIGVTIMAGRKAIIKKLPAVETLGCAQVICSDKTGTITQNKMEIQKVYYDAKTYTSQDFLDAYPTELVGNILYLCNDSDISPSGQEIGDPTETCLKRFILLKKKPQEFDSLKRIKDLPFDSVRKMMSTVNHTPDGDMVFTKGAPDQLLARCTRIIENGAVRELTEADREAVLAANSAMAHEALRVLGLAYKPYEDGEELEENLIFTGLTGMLDPPRPEAAEAIARCKDAGIVPVMITGDHRDTAVAIARKIGIIENESQAIFGAELDDMTDEQFDKKLDDYRVYARVSPEHKVRIVKAWQSRQMVVAMTGDGVNDAPALKTADIGVGMGITGTDVSKGVSDMLLSDDNFATIVNAVEEGRRIYNNIRKAVQFLLSSNISEVFSIFLVTLLMPASVTFLLPVHILWINLVTDSLPAIGLGMNKAHSTIMKEPPRDSSTSFFANGLGFKIIMQGLMLMAATLASFFIGRTFGAVEATTMAFITLSFSQLSHSMNIKCQEGTFFSKKAFDNKFMLIGIFVPVVLMVLLVNIPVLAALFEITTLSLTQWLIACGLSLAVIPVNEFFKLLTKKK